MARGASFSVHLADLRLGLAEKRRLLASLTSIANERDEIVPHYGDVMREIAQRALRLEEFAGLIEHLIPHEDTVHALAAYRPVEALPAYEPPRSTDKLYDGRSVLVRGAASWDMGAEVKVMFSLGQMVTIARTEIVGVRAG